MTDASADKPFAGKVAVVTGATGKIGRQIARSLARGGARLAVHYSANRSLADELAKELDGCAYQADFLDRSGPERLTAAVLEDFGRVDILINSASQFPSVRLEQTDDRLWQNMFDLHATSAWRLVNALTENFRSHPGSSIVNMVDIWAIRPKAAFGAYIVAKAALVALTTMWAEELSPGTTVNAVAPGIIDMAPDLLPAEHEKIIAHIPLARPGTGEEVADLVVAICTFRYVTGTTIAVDGGRSLTWD